MPPATFAQLRSQIDFAEAHARRAPTRDDALEATLDAAELCMRALKLNASKADKQQIDQQCRALLDYAEEVKGTARREATGVASSKDSDSPSRSTTVSGLKEPCSSRPLTTREQIILLEGSKLHGAVFPPWRCYNHHGYEDRLIKYLYYPNFSDIGSDDFDFRLSDVQLKVFDGWQRPNAIHPPLSPNLPGEDPGRKPTMRAPARVDLVQDITADCSVVASLCAGTARSERGHPKILPSILHPFDLSVMQPAVSPNGKYIFKLYFNGCWRKVTIDDRLPSSKTSRSLYVVDRNERSLLWPALVEKAYLKARGGYNLPGSNSGTDLWVLTSWIPEQLFLQSDEIDRAALWLRVSRAFVYGDVLVTMGTGRLTDLEEEGMGLAGEHDYAVIDMKETAGQRLLLVKNPWSKATVWRGSTDHAQLLDDACSLYPARDEAIAAIQTHELMPGTFWMDLNDIFQSFDSIYLNWNPALFSYREDIHFTWNLATSRSPPGFFGSNPQYEIRNSACGVVWLLLSKHFKSRPSSLDGKIAGQADGIHGYISLYAYQNGGEKVFKSDNALVRGPYVDSPNTLLKLELRPNSAHTIVISEQALSRSSYNFTLSAFSNEQLVLKQAREKYEHRLLRHGAWTFLTSGGNASSSTYSTNPSFSMHLAATSDVAFLLEADEDFPVHVKLLWAHARSANSITACDTVGDSGEYREGYAFTEIRQVESGTYTIVCSTFEQGQLGKFNLTVFAMCSCTVDRVLLGAAGRLVSKLETAFSTTENNRVMAPLFLTRLTRLRVGARWSQHGTNTAKSTHLPLKIGLECGQGSSKSILAVSGNDEFLDPQSGPHGLETPDVDLQPRICQQRGVWVVVERLGCATLQHSTEVVQVDVLSDTPVEIGPWRVGDD